MKGKTEGKNSIQMYSSKQQQHKNQCCEKCKSKRRRKGADKSLKQYEKYTNTL